jgi:hypothetical protein
MTGRAVELRPLVCPARLPVLNPIILLPNGANDGSRSDSCKTFNAIHELNDEIHYLSCQGGVGRSSSKETK